MTNALLQGLNDLSTVHGAMADFINAIEVVLPTGELTKIGSCILGEHNWFGHHPLPDLLSLFLGWQGMTGIVTRIAVQLWPKLPCVSHAALLTFGERPSVALLKHIARANLVEDGECMSFSLLKMLMGIGPPVRQLEGEPDYGTLLTLSGHSETEVAEKYKAIENLVAKSKQQDPRQLLVPWQAIAKLVGEDAHSWVDFPSDVFKILCEYDGLTWVGTYIHPRHWSDALEQGRRIVTKYGFELMAFLKAMKGMHFGEFKFIIRFDKGVPRVITKVRKCNEELLDMALSLGALPYKTPVWAARKVLVRADPNWVKLVRRIHDTLDPNHILNPGRWGL
jgi:glycolate oxidase